MRRGILNPNNYWIVAVEDEIITGTALMTLQGEIHLCYLLPEFLHRGIGKAMLDDMIGFARESGLQKVTLGSTRTAREFYKRNGFIELGEIEWMERIPSFKMQCDITDDFA
jgi:N-acetylglutamate synthase-like GNAT family acetyltransferase